MANKTLYGIVAQETREGDRRPLTRSVTFRLHVGDGATDTEDYAPQQFACDVWHTAWLPGPVIKFSAEPSPNVIYERELHLAVEKDHKGRRRLRLKEGPRYMSAEVLGPLAYGLALFLLLEGHPDFVTGASKGKTQSV